MLFDLPPHLTIVSLAFLLGGFVKGVTGLGLPAAAMGLLSLVMAPVEAAALLIVPALVTNVWQLAAGPSLGTLLHRLWPMMAGVVAGTLASAGVIQGENGDLASAGLGAALVIYAALGLTAARFRVVPSAERWLGPSMGLATGLVTGMTGVSVIPSAPYLAALGLAKEELVQALGLTFTVSMVTLGTVLAGSGVLDSERAATSALALVPALAGLMLGGWLRGRVGEAAFRRCFFLGLLALGLHLVARMLG